MDSSFSKENAPCIYNMIISIYKESRMEKDLTLPTVGHDMQSLINKAATLI